MSNKTKKQLILHIPYVMMGLITTNLGEAWRLAEGTNASEKILSLSLRFRQRSQILYRASIRLTF